VYSLLDSRNRLIVETARNGETPFVVFGGEGANIRLIPLGEPIDWAALEQDRENGMRYAGVIGVRNGHIETATSPHAGSHELSAMLFAGLALSRQVFGDELDFLNRLWALSDTREVHHA